MGIVKASAGCAVNTLLGSQPRHIRAEDPPGAVPLATSAREHLIGVVLGDIGASGGPPRNERCHAYLRRPEYCPYGWVLLPGKR